MLKKIISTLLCVLMVFQVTFVTPPALASGINIIMNEEFDNIPTNSTVENALVSSSVKVVDFGKTNKALYSALGETSFKYVKELELPDVKEISRVVFSADVKISGTKVSGSVMTLGSSPLLSFEKNGSIVLHNGLSIGSYSIGLHTYSAVINFKSMMYDIYIDGKCVVTDISFASSATLPQKMTVVFKAANGGEGEVWVDNIRLYEAPRLMPDSAFEPIRYNTEISVTSSADDEDITNIYIDNHSDNGISPTFALGNHADDVAKFDYAPKDKTKSLRLLQRGTLNVYADIKTPIDNGIDSFVCEMDLRVEKNVNGIYLFRFMKGNNYWYLFQFTNNGYLTSNGTRLAKIPMGEWFKLSAIVDMILGEATYYVNGELVAEEVRLSGTVVEIPQTVRVGWRSSVPENAYNDVYMDNLKMYSGSKFISFKDEVSSDGDFVEEEPDKNEDLNNSGLNLVSIMESEKRAKNLLGADSLFMTNNDSYYVDKEKRSYTNFGAKAYIDENGVTMVPSKLVEQALDVTIKLSGDKIEASNGKLAFLSKKETDYGILDAPPIIKDDVLYLPAASFATIILNKYSYIDGHGFIMLSASPITYVNKNGAHENLEDIDVIYRYMQYDNPTGDQIYADMYANGKPQRPLFLKRTEELNALREKIQKDPEFKKAAITLVDSAEKLFDKPYVKWEIYDGTRLLDRCHSVTDVCHTLVTAYLLTNDTKYLDRLWAEMEYVLVEWPDFNMPGAASKQNSSPGHFLDVGTLCEGIAMAYDVLHDYLRPSELQLFKDKLQEKCLDYFVGVFNGESDFKGTDGRTRSSNWGAVVGGGMFMISMSVLASEPADSLLATKCKFIAENSMKMLQYPIGHFYPYGAIAEGIGYYGFNLSGIGYSINAMINMCGTDYGFLDSPGFEQAGNYLIYIQSLNGLFNMANSSNSDKNLVWYDETTLLTSLYGNNEMAKTLNAYRRALGKGVTDIGLLFGTPTNHEASLDYSLDKYMDSFHSMRGSWTDKNAVFTAICAGYNDISDQRDKGNFIFECDGVRWFSDMGKGNYNVEGGYFSQSGLTLYRSRAEGHNCMVFNPVNDGKADQIVGASTKLVKDESKDRGSIAIFDLTDIYGTNRVKKYERGFFLTDDRWSLIVQDEVEVATPDTEFYHFMHVIDDGEITINPDGRSATVKKNGEILDVSIICDADEWKLEKWDAVYIDPTMQRSNEYSRDGMTKIAIVGKDSDTFTISVKMGVRDKGRVYSEHTKMPMHAWKIADGKLPQKAFVDSVSINGLNYDAFDRNQTNYIVSLLTSDTVAQLDAESFSGTIEITQPKTFDDNGVVTVTSPDSVKTIYRFSFRYPTKSSADGSLSLNDGFPVNVRALDIKDVTATDIPQPENAPFNVADGNLGTKWAGLKKGASLTIDVGTVEEIAGLAISWNDSDTRSYEFDIELSDDGVNFTKVYSGKNPKSPSEYQFLIIGKKARFVRYTGYGSDVNAWNNLREFRACVNK